MRLIPAIAKTDRSSPEAFVKDSVITTKIKVRLAAEKLDSLRYISVDTDNNGIVTLSGTVKTRAEADKAASIARHVEGVAAVEDKMLVAARE